MASLNPYLSFHDDAREAMEFYRSVFGGELEVSTFGSFGAAQDPADEEKVMHAQLTTPDGFVLMGADTPSSIPYREPVGVSVSVSVSGEDEVSLRGFWDGLAHGGVVTVPLDTPPWGGLFGMLTDRYGVEWMVAVTAAD